MRKLGSTQSGARNEGLRFNRPNSSRSNLGHRPPVASAMGNARAARVGETMDELLQDGRGRILFGLDMSVAHSTVSDVVYVAAGREAGFSRSFS